MKCFGDFKLEIKTGEVATIHVDSDHPLTQIECNKIFRKIGKYFHDEGFDKHYLDIHCEEGFADDVGNLS